MTCPFRGGALTLLRQHVTEAPPAIPNDVVEKLGPRVSDVITRLLAKEPRNRFQSAAELSTALDEGTGAVASTFVTADPNPVHPRSVRAPVGIVLAGTVALAVGAAVLFVTSTKIEQAPVITSSAAPSLSAAPATPPSQAARTSDPPGASSEASGASRPPSSAAPAESSRAAAPRPSRAKKTGPGGIYVPPPRDWFKK